MIFFGHLGITTAAIKIYDKFSLKDEGLEKSYIDYRIVLAGAVLPDIIDKPIGAFFLRNVFHNSRIFAHTLVFSLILILIGIYRLHKYSRRNVLVLGLSSCIHLILDSMWNFSAILFWPLYGWKFPERPEGAWLQSDLIKLFSDPSTYMPELIGFGIMFYYFIKLLKKKKMWDFVTQGRL